MIDFQIYIPKKRIILGLFVENIVLLLQENVCKCGPIISNEQKCFELKIGKIGPKSVEHNIRWKY